MFRGIYGELKEIGKPVMKQVRNLIDAVTERVDEHGGWEFGAELNKKGVGTALNWDLYAFGKDLHTKKSLAVIQVRQYMKRYRGWYPSVRRNYFLLGRNEDGTAFAHPIESRVVYSAIARGENVIRAVQRWIFSCDYAKVVRQGDVAFAPVQRGKGEVHDKKQITIAESHQVSADEIRENGDAIYALNPKSIHPTHPKIELQGWWKIVVGQRARFWKFARPTKD